MISSGEFLRRYRAMKLDAFEKKFLALSVQEQNQMIGRLVEVAKLGDEQREIKGCVR
jgi:hypothetical protein